MKFLAVGLGLGGNGSVYDDGYGGCCGCSACPGDISKDTRVHVIFRFLEMTTRDMNGMSHSYYHELREKGAVLSQMGADHYY